ncbi:hypothetical protein [Vineibacter terrae]|nr:hypothetical protein [Vineibacter terrae]
MSDFLRALAAWRAQALAIATAPHLYTASQRALAWRVLRRHGARAA